MKAFINEWWKYVLMFVLMVVTNYVNAVTTGSESWVWTLNGSLFMTAAWHAFEQVLIRYEASKKKV